MKKHENIIATIGAVALLLGVMLTPSINAMMLEGKTVETTTKTMIAKEDKMTEKIESNDYKPGCFGSIYGYIEYYFLQWAIHTPIAFALVDAEIKSTRSNIIGYYELKDLPINQSYTVTVTARGYKSKSIDVHLTSERPNEMINFYLVSSNDGITMQTQIDNGNSNIYIYQILEPTQGCHLNSQNNLILQAIKTTNR